MKATDSFPTNITPYAIRGTSARRSYVSLTFRGDQPYSMDAACSLSIDQAEELIADLALVIERARSLQPEPGEAAEHNVHSADRIRSESGARSEPEGGSSTYDGPCQRCGQMEATALFTQSAFGASWWICASCIAVEADRSGR